MSPCFTGWLTEAVAATFGAEPSPASLLNKPRFVPITTAMPIVPPTVSFMPNAFSMIRLRTRGSLSRFKAMIVMARSRYATAMIGTMY